MDLIHKFPLRVGLRGVRVKILDKCALLDFDVRDNQPYSECISFSSTSDYIKFSFNFVIYQESINDI